MSSQNKNLRAGVEVRKNDNESVGGLARRFVQKVRKDGILIEARSRRFYKKPSNRRARREGALVRAERRKEYAKLKKWGKVK